MSFLFFAKPYKLNTAENTIRIGYPIYYQTYDLQTYSFYLYVADLAPLALKSKYHHSWKLVVFALPRDATTILTKNIHVISGRTNLINSAEKEKDKLLSLLQDSNAYFNVDTATHNFTVITNPNSNTHEKSSIAFFNSILKEQRHD